MINELKTLITASNPLYEVEYEEARMMNLNADEKSIDSAFAYIEEFTQGKYIKSPHIPQKTTRVQIYFCRFGEFQTTAVEREAIRSHIEIEIVFPFIKKYNDSHLFDKVNDWNFYTPLPRFDANEVSIMLEFDCKQDILTKW